MTEPQCDADVWERPLYIYRHRCPWRGRYRRETRDYGTLNLCGAHNRVKTSDLWLWTGVRGPYHR